MEHPRSDVAPATLSVRLDEKGIGVEYLDGREVFYHGVPEPTDEVRTMPNMNVHVLVTDPSGTEGVLTYVDERTTHDDVLESTGVGRVLLGDGESEELFPGVTVRRDGRSIEVETDPDLVDGRVFVFEESELGERSYEIVDDADGGDDGEANGEENE